ncbi:MAG: VOC family protein [Myxococcales bacterium]|nr:VOC family protein [Myxococcales bacterium]MDD9964682.1 VOC family protein [Myxococcales bacterium]
MRLTRIHQVAAKLGDLDQTRDFYRNVLGARHLATFEPPGLLFFDFAGTRMLFEASTPPAIVYFWVDDLDQAHATLSERGVVFDAAPHRIHKDEEGLFDNPGTEEWMAFFKDPAGNTIGLATRRAANP